MGKSKIDEVSKNTITSAKINGVYIEAGSTITKLNSNTINSSGNNAVHCVGKISCADANIFKSNKNFAMAFPKGSSGVVYKNTFSGNKTGTIYSVSGNKSYKTTSIATPTVKSKKSGSTVNFSWKAINNASSYEIWFSKSKDGTYTKKATTTKKSYSVKAAAKGYYRVVAVRNAGTVRLKSYKSGYIVV